MLPFMLSVRLLPFSFALIFSLPAKIIFPIGSQNNAQSRDADMCECECGFCVCVCACVHEFSFSPFVRPLFARALYLFLPCQRQRRPFASLHLHSSA